MSLINSVDLTTQYLGMTLAHPIVAAASPLSRTAEGVHQLAKAGAAAVVLSSLFAEQIGSECGPSSAPCPTQQFPGWGRDSLGTDEYLNLIALARRYVDIPIIASLDADGPGEWTRFAARLTDSGVNALELNLYHIAADREATADSVERAYVDAVTAVRSATSLPLAVKIGPFFSALPCFARRLADAGADSLVLFNRYLEPDFDPVTRSAAKCDVVLSQSRHDLRLPLRWTAVLSGTLGDGVQTALTGGVHTGTDAVKALMAGAAVVQVASELVAHGAERLTGIRAEVAAWLRGHGYGSAQAVRGLMRVKEGEQGSASRAERDAYLDEIRLQPG
jgi:dihydroorotate dehydrogenase (fumarate)